MGKGGAVSIPSSSGHQFTEPAVARADNGQVERFNPFFIRASVYWAGPFYRTPSGRLVTFQSLLHQGISLLHAYIGPLSLPEDARVSIPSSSGHQFTDRTMWNFAKSRSKVSIPSSSGHQFTARFRRVPGVGGTRRVSIPSSSGHQFTVGHARLERGVNSAAFQSLLHQGISLLGSFIRQQALMRSVETVSIPSSSGHQFTVRGESAHRI